MKKILICIFIAVVLIPIYIFMADRFTDLNQQPYSGIMFFISVIQLPISIIATWFVSDWYHKKKNQPDEIWLKNRQNKIDSLKQRTGHSFSLFKEEFGNILSKNTIVEHDLVLYNKKDYGCIINTLQQNHKNILDKWDEYLKWVHDEEIRHYVDFFTYMLWFISYFQLKSFNESDIQEVNDLFNKIKSQAHEFDDISHKIGFTSTLSPDDSKRISGIKYFRSPVSKK